MTYTDGFWYGLREALAVPDSIPSQLLGRIKELCANHETDAIQPGDTDFAKGKLAAFRMLVDEIESANKKIINPNIGG